MGCGNGRNLKHLARQGYDVAGIDLSETALGQLRGDLRREKLTAEIQHGSFYQIPYEDETFGGAMAVNTLQHNDWDGANKSFSEMSRVLKEGAPLLVRVRSASRSLPERRIDIQDHGITFVPQEGTKAGIKLHHYTREEIEELAQKNDLEIVDMQEDKQEPKKGAASQETKAQWVVTFRRLPRDKE